MVSEDACAEGHVGGSVSLFPNLFGCTFLGRHFGLTSYSLLDREGLEIGGVAMLGTEEGSVGGCLAPRE